MRFRQFKMFWLINGANELLNSSKTELSQKEEDGQSVKNVIQAQSISDFQNWSLLLRGLVHPDNLTRKRCLYLLKRIIEDRIDSPEKIEIFQRIFLVLETVDEKQVHIVKQIFGHINSLWTVQECLPWTLVIFRRLFLHQNQAIAKTSLIHFLTMEQKFVDRTCFQEFVEDSLLIAFNNPKFHDTLELFDAFKTFLKHFKGHWSNLLKSVMTISWAPIPLFHCLRAVQEATDDSNDKVYRIDFEQIKEFVSWNMKCQELLIRGAAQECLLKIFINLTVAKNAFQDVNDLQTLLRTFNVVIRGTEIYKQMCHWLKPYLEVNEIDNPILFVMKCDNQELKIEDILVQNWILSKIDTIKQNAFRLYGPNILNDLIKIGKVLRFLSKPQSRPGRDHLAHKEFTNKTIEQVQLEHINDLADIVIQCLNKVDLEQTDYLISILEHLIDKDVASDKVQDLSKHLSQLSIQELKVLDTFNDCMNNDMINDAIERKQFPKLNDKYQGAESSIHLSFQWKIVPPNPALIETALEHIEIGGLNSVCPIIESVFKIADQVDQETLQTFIRLAKSAVFDLRKNDQFWPAFEALVKVWFYPSLSDESLNEALEEVIKQSELIHGFALVMMNFVENNFKMYSESFQISFLCKCIIYGPVFKKDQIMLSTINEYIFNHNFAVNIFEGSDHNVDVQVRAKAVQLLLQHSFNDIQTLIKTLSNNESKLTGGKKRYFDNSAIHLVKQRSAQALLLCSPMFKNDDLKDIIDICVENIEAPSQQLSVRYLYEWILMRLNGGPLVIETIKDRLAESKKSRLGIVPAYLMILTNVQGVLTVEEKLAILAPWCLGQQFMTRLCANLCFKKVFVQGDQNIQEKYSVLYRCIQDTLEQGDTTKNEEKAFSDFYLNDFDPCINFNLSDIFHHFNRLMNVNDIIHESLWTNTKLSMDITNAKSLLRSREPNVSKPLVDLTNLTSDSIGQVQKKITPWQQMFDLEQESKKESAFPDLIVVASLIDRAPNLGGLSRTCEIFGVGKLVLNNRKILEDKDFLSTSVTAHQWISIEEVNVENLMEYLMSMKLNGYKIVGIEQTSESQSLQDFQFPKKSVILLGNEKEGLPVEYIQLLDGCVEIPQSGLIRSLNVHVTGAIVIWEYVRQNLMK